MNRPWRRSVGPETPWPMSGGRTIWLGDLPTDRLAKAKAWLESIIERWPDIGDRDTALLDPFDLKTTYVPRRGGHLISAWWAAMRDELEQRSDR